jgi:enoyl-[acyl-carrier-protein] reductase (NADH)
MLRRSCYPAAIHMHLVELLGSGRTLRIPFNPGINENNLVLEGSAIRSFARSWTVDLKQRKIRVNSISPGPIDTPGLRHALQSVQDAEKLITTYLNAVPLGRFDYPEDVASAVSFPASNDSSFVTGIELSVDSGMAQI